MSDKPPESLAESRVERTQVEGKVHSWPNMCERGVRVLHQDLDRTFSHQSGSDCCPLLVFVLHLDLLAMKLTVMTDSNDRVLQ